MKTIAYVAAMLALLLLPYGGAKAQTSITNYIPNTKFNPGMLITPAAKNRISAELEVTNNNFTDLNLVCRAQISRHKPNGDGMIIFDVENVPFTVPANGRAVFDICDAERDESGVMGGYYVLTIRVEGGGSYALMTHRVDAP